MTSSPFFTLKLARSPFSSRLPSPTLRTLPRRGFSLAVSGRTMPLLVLLSASTRFTRILSPSGRNLAIVYAPSDFHAALRAVVKSYDHGHELGSFSLREPGNSRPDARNLFHSKSGF